MDKAIELLGEKKEETKDATDYAVENPCKAFIEDKEAIGSNQMHSKAVEVVVGLLEDNEELKNVAKSASDISEKQMYKIEELLKACKYALNGLRNAGWLYKGVSDV